MGGNGTKVAANKNARAALLLIDVVNDLQFPEGEQLLQQALPASLRIAALKKSAVERGVPVIYLNDNFGHWRSDLNAQVRHAQASPRGKQIIKDILPGEEDYFVLKPTHSGFHGTVLELLLKYLNVDRLILCGMATNICVLFTASDAYMRGYELWVPEDCVAANTKELSRNALQQMESVLKADTRSTDDRSLDEWRNQGVVNSDRLVHGGDAWSPEATFQPRQSNIPVQEISS